MACYKKYWLHSTQIQYTPLEHQKNKSVFTKTPQTNKQIPPPKNSKPNKTKKPKKTPKPHQKHQTKQYPYLNIFIITFIFPLSNLLCLIPLF